MDAGNTNFSYLTDELGFPAESATASIGPTIFQSFQYVYTPKFEAKILNSMPIQGDQEFIEFLEKFK